MRVSMGGSGVIVPTVACGVLACCPCLCGAALVEVGGAATLREPPASILLNEWESDAEIRVWLERQTTLQSGVTLGHHPSGYIETQSQLVGGFVPRGTAVESYMIRLDPIGSGPAIQTGWVRFDQPILGVLIGSQLGPTDATFARPGVVYNANSFRGLELDGPGQEIDTFSISQDRFRIDFGVDVGSWTDDIRVITLIPPQCLGDINNDGSVGTPDLTLLLSSFGQQVIPGVGGDLNSDGVVNTNDLTRFLGRFGRPCVP